MFITIINNFGKQIDINPLHVVMMEPANEFFRVTPIMGTAFSVTAADRQKILDKGQEILDALRGEDPDETS